ncbi:MAG: caspase family protein [Phormidesmis sp.]
MANYWAITIGINQYRHLQPLRHAQNDALFVHRFFVEEAGIAADRCILLSDITTSVGHQAVYPDKPAIAAWIHTITQQVGADDILWFFFSGYGVQLEEADYLMPIDGDPGQIKDTGIAVADLIDTLAQLPAAHTVLVLDINRSQGALAGQTIGTQAMSLAQQQQIPLLLSCQPEQYSHETLGVHHGLFTAALLEALQQNYRTLDQLGDYVAKRLPELCDHHWRPIQNLVSLVPGDQGNAVVVPEVPPVAGAAVTAPLALDAEAETTSRTDNWPVSAGLDREDSQAETESIGRESALATEEPPIEPPWQSAANANGTAATDANLYTDDLYIDNPVDDRDSAYFESADTIGSDDSTAAISQPNGTIEGAADSSAIVPYQNWDTSSPVSGAKLRNWGLLALALLVGGVLLKQPFVATAWEGLSQRLSMPTIGESPQAADEGSEEELAAEATDGSAMLDPEESDAPAAQPTVVETSAANDAATREQEAAAGKALIAQATAALEQRQYSEALIALQQVPQSQRDATFSSVLTQARAGAAEAQQANASVLTDARTAIQPTQASQFAEAIAKAGLIQSGEPYYEEAQQDIRSWSQIILDIAEGRATSGNLGSAIAAANAMPEAAPEFRKKAQERVAFWQQRQRSRDIIFAARQIPASGQASSYQKAIVKLREVPIEHPEYETAQQQADEWSDRIFSIAQARAAQGRPSAAIQAAILVPAGTTAYEPAQQAIKRWQAEG